LPASDGLVYHGIPPDLFRFLRQPPCRAATGIFRCSCFRREERLNPVPRDGRADRPAAHARMFMWSSSTPCRAEK
jgi:hypothetical protein